jgi:hypothetical protein
MTSHRLLLGTAVVIPAAIFVSDHLDDVCIGPPRLLMTFTSG